MQIRFLTRTGCHLCDDARPVVEWAVARRGGTVVELDVDLDDDLLVKYGLRIPVVLAPDGSVLAEGRITDRRGLARRLRAWAGT